MIVVKEILDRKEVVIADNSMTMFYVGYRFHLEEIKQNPTRSLA